MKGSIKNELAPSRGKQSGPTSQTQSSVINSDYTTAIMGGNNAGPVHGWEAIQPKRSNKPKFLVEAQAAEDQAWLNYLWLIDHKPEAWAAQQEAWDRYDTAKRKASNAYQAFCQGLETQPIPF